MVNPFPPFDFTLSPAQFGIFIIVLLAMVAGAIWIYFRRHRDIRMEAESLPQFKEVLGFKLHYTVQGKGEKILLLHGIGAQIYSWRRLVPLLSRNFTVIALDLPGFGLSSKLTSEKYGLDEQCERIEEFTRQMGISRTRLIGSSMGGAIALELACRNPKQFFQVVCISPATSRHLLPAKVYRLSWASGGLQYLVTPTFVSGILKKVVNRKELRTPSAVAQYLSPYLRQPQAVGSFLLASRLLTDPRLETNPGRVKVPVLYLWGAKDKIIPLRYLRKLQKDWGEKILALTHSKGGHHLMEDEPEWVNKACTDFFLDHEKLGR
ncbi:MAG: alpha/beta hydrolase [Bdellovibrionales bacterium]|nr:alpha/beta hydrolase [Bdellovibrionales bacterium]